MCAHRDELPDIITFREGVIRRSEPVLDTLLNEGSDSYLAYWWAKAKAPFPCMSRGEADLVRIFPSNPCLMGSEVTCTGCIIGHEELIPLVDVNDPTQVVQGTIGLEVGRGPAGVVYNLTSVHTPIDSGEIVPASTGTTTRITTPLVVKCKIFTLYEDEIDVSTPSLIVEQFLATVLASALIAPRVRYVGYELASVDRFLATIPYTRNTNEHAKAFVFYTVTEKYQGTLQDLLAALRKWPDDGMITILVVSEIYNLCYKLVQSDIVLVHIKAGNILCSLGDNASRLIGQTFEQSLEVIGKEVNLEVKLTDFSLCEVRAIRDNEPERERHFFIVYMLLDIVLQSLSIPKHTRLRLNQRLLHAILHASAHVSRDCTQYERISVDIVYKFMRSVFDHNICCDVR